MFRKCKHCGFKNPIDVGDCLVCHKTLPTSIGEVRESLKNLEDLSQGKVREVGKRVAEGYVGEAVSSVKYRFSPVWWLKVKLHRLKQSLISLLWILGIIIGLAILGGIINLFKK